MALRLYTIPPHRSFADALVAGLIATYRKDELGLARGIILVPNNRAARSISDAFVRRSGGGLLLPRLVPIGDPELDERVGGAIDPLDADDPVPPAVEPVERLMLLARLVQQHRGVDAAEALRLAADLARTLDQLLIEETDPARLLTIADEAAELSAHWQKSLAELDLILREWPRELERIGRIDLSDRRNRLLDRLSRRWRSAPPAGFVAVAGITTSAPAVARLLRTVSRLPEGMVVFPGLDLAMPPAEWDALGPHQPDPETERRRRSIETHAQFHLKLLLDRMGAGRGEVERWRWGGGRGAPAARSRAIANAMAPARFTGKWLQLKPADRRLTGVRGLELADPAEEAQTIAVALREAIEIPGRTAALVTPDRALAQRVSGHLRRWGIVADDSAGRPLVQLAPGTLLLAIAEAAVERFAPVPLLALLKHPLVMAGEERLDWLEGVRRLDAVLRGPRPPAGLGGIAGHLADRSGRDRDLRGEAAAFWSKAAPLLEPLEAVFAPREPDLASVLAGLREAASRLTSDQAWAGVAGRAAAELFAAIEEAASLGPQRLAPASVPPLLEQFLSGAAVRPPYGQHPRIFIWGLLEARLQHCDLMILGGLNEGTWPQLPAPDPWLAPRIRGELGLPGLERRIGLSAHDFASALGGPQVLVTRARRDARSPAIASRFWLRLEAMTGGLTRARHYRAYARAIDKPAGHIPAPRPAPAPPARERPDTISVTEVDRLKADPFAFYARKMLRLAPLDQVDADPSAAWRGSEVHKVLEAWMKEDDCDPAKLRPRAEALLASDKAHPLMRALWHPRLMEAVDWMAERMAEEQARGRVPLRAEAWGEHRIAGVTLQGMADRIDRLLDGKLAIVDYKTGMPPSARAVADGYSMQLGLIGLIAEHGGFEDVEGIPAAFEYWSFARKAGKLGHVATPVGGANRIAADEFTTIAARNFIAAAEAWLTGEEPFTAKLHPEYAPYGDYDQLMRLEEWYGREGAGGEPPAP